MARDPNVIAKSGEVKPKEEKKSSPQAKPQVSTQEAKDLRALISTLSEKNSPQSSKDVTALAKQTLKVVAQSQKSASDAFRKEAAKALLDFRAFVEKTDKVNEVRRNKLISDIDHASLDAKSATYMMLSVAKQQAKNMKDEAIRAVIAEKIKLKQTEKTILTEAEIKAKQMQKEAKLKSKQMTAEHAEKLKLMTAERKQKLDDMKNAIQAANQAKKDKLKQDKESAAAALFDRRERFIKEKEDHKKAKEADALELKQKRADAANKIKKIKQELGDRFKQKSNELKDANDKRKSDQLQRNKDRIQRIRELQVDHKARLKKIEDDAKAENVVKKIQLKERVREINDDAKARRAKHERNADNLTGKIKDGIYDANPLIHAAVEIGSGIVGHLAKRMGDRKKEKQLNKLTHSQQTGTPNPTPNTTPAPTPPANPGQSSEPEKGGMFEGILKLLPTVTGIVSGISSLFSGIASVGSTMFKIIGGGSGLAFIAGAALVINGIMDFMDGFNNAGALFGKAFDGSITQKLWSGFVNVGAMLWGVVDSIAGFFGFDTHFKKMYQEIGLSLYTTVAGVFNSVVDAVSGIFNAIVGAVKSFAGVVGTILSYVPGAGGAAKALQAFAGTKPSPSGEIKPPDAPPAVSQITAKQDNVNSLSDDLAVRKAMSGPVQAVVDNSSKLNQTNIITQKLDTRNNDPTHRLYGYGGSTTFR